MSKIKEITLAYPNVSQATVKKFYESDHTQTKKYFEYMVKMWFNRKNNNRPQTTAQIIEIVSQFDKLLPYITNKDIYSKHYNNFDTLCDIVSKAQEDKEDSTFVKEEHVTVLDETDEYICLIPKTHLGSIKYGRGTKWCTASKRDETTFKRYVKNGLLVYLIRKNIEEKNDFNRIAFYFDDMSSPFTSNAVSYNEVDYETDDNSILKNGWDRDVIIKLTVHMRMYFAEWIKTKKSREEVEKVIEIISNINFESLNKHVEQLESSINNDYISKLKNIIDSFKKNLNEKYYGISSTKN